MARIHPTAVVDPRAKLADDVVIGPHVVIGDEVELADGVEIISHASVTGRTSVGAGTRVFPFVVLGQRNIIREHVSIHVGTRSGGACTRIGDDNMIMNNVHIAHDCRVGSHCELSSFSGLAGHVTLEDHVVLGAMTGIHQFVRVGESAFTGANSMLNRDVPPFVRVAGDRARFAGMNTFGLERRGFSHETLAQLKHALHLLFHSKLLLAQALERVTSECGGCPEVVRLLDFLTRSERGFVR